MTRFDAIGMGWVKLAASLLLAAIAFAHALPARADVEVLTLRYRSAEQMLPVLQPLVEPGGALTGMQNQLIIRASAKNIADIRKVLESMDRMPRRLMITVRQSTDSGGSTQGGVVYGSAGVGNSAQGGRVGAQIYDSRDARADGTTQTLQVMEGSSAFIQAGASVPLTTSSVVGVTAPNRSGQSGAVVGSTTTYRDVMTGFDVVPRVNGDRVMLDISQRRDTPPNASGAIGVQRASSTISAKLGEWVELGGVATNEMRSSGGLAGSINSQTSSNRRILVKVEEVK